MKITNQITKLMLVALIAILTFSCSTSDDDKEIVVSKSSILDIAKADPNFSLLVAIIKKTGLDVPGASTLSLPGSYTVFAPTNAAFLATPATATLTVDNVTALKTTVPAEKATIDFLKQVVLNHILSGAIRANDITTGYVKTFAQYNGSSTILLSMYINKTGADVILNGGSATVGAIGGKVVKADINASNGVIHVVDRVLLLPTLVDHVKINTAQFSTLLNVLTSDAAGAYGDQSAVLTALSTATSNPLISATNTKPSLTVFAPNNDAFAAATTATGYLKGAAFSVTSTDTPPVVTPNGPNFTKVLLYHVTTSFPAIAPATRASSGNLTASSATSWSSDDITINTLAQNAALTNQQFKIEKGTLKITEIPTITTTPATPASLLRIVNIQGTNGVIHTINRVLQPVL